MWILDFQQINKNKKKRRKYENQWIEEEVEICFHKFGLRHLYKQKE